MKTSHSEVDTYLSCRRKHWYGYGRKLERKVHSTALNRGKAGHAVLETYYRAAMQGYSHERAVAEARHHFQNIKSQGVGDEPLVNGGFKHTELEVLLFEWYFENEPFYTHGWEILAVEKEFLFEYEEGKFMPLVIDLIARNPQGKIVVIDHKITYDFYSERDMKIQSQLPKYVGAIRAMGLPAEKAAYNMLRYRKQKALTVDKVLSWVYLDMNDSRVLTAFQEQIGVAGEIAERKLLPLEVQDKTAFRAANKMVCNSCAFLDLCNTELIDGDTELMIHTEYKTKTPRNFGTAPDIQEDELV